MKTYTIFVFAEFGQPKKIFKYKMTILGLHQNIKKNLILTEAF